MTNQPKAAIGYMCHTTWEEHVPDDWKGWHVYPSLESVKENAKCTTTGCGIVKVSMKFEQIVEWGEL